MGKYPRLFHATFYVEIYSTTLPFYYDDPHAKLMATTLKIKLKNVRDFKFIAIC